MSNVVALKRKLDTERAKLIRQENAIEDTKSLIEILEAQVNALEKKR